jgi:hypothetical protein
MDNPEPRYEFFATADGGRWIKVFRAPWLDTGIGREAGYANDAEFIAAYNAQRAEAERLLTPEALAELDAADRECERRLLGG